MLRTLMAILILLHGLVHMWYVTLSQGWVEFQPEMGWTGNSWILSNFLQGSTIRSIASVLYIAATILFIGSGIGILLRADWLPTILVGSAIFSSAAILLFWDGNTQLLVQKGLLGLIINIGILAAVFFGK